MKKLVRAAMLTVVMFVGANAQSVRDQVEEQKPQALAATPPQQCFLVNGVWVCTDD
jgi:uncharacterized lipoprotein NlpE involved in copper resistance